MNDRIEKILLFCIVALLAFTQTGLLAYYFQFTNVKNDFVLTPNISEEKMEESNEEMKYDSIHYAYFMGKSFYEKAYSLGLSQLSRQEDKVYGGILPHHLIVKDKIAAFFENIKDNNYETVILIGPNHFEAGESNIIVSEALWKTPFGELEPDLDLISQITKGNALVKIEEKPFEVEHSISGLIGFIKKSLPGVKFVPIILKYKTSEEECERLARLIKTNISPEKTLVLASVDFSHYMPAEVAEFHDQKSNSIIQSFDYERVFDLEIDSPASIYTVLKYLDSVSSQTSELIFHTNSGILFNLEDEPTTSHNFYYFSKGRSLADKAVNFMFFGDLMLDRYVKDVIEDRGINSIFQKLAGEENRFFRGLDIIGANLEGAVTNEGAHYTPEYVYDFAFDPKQIEALKSYNFNYFTLANNHVSDQGLIGFEETRNNLNNLDFYYSGCRDKTIADCSTTVVEIAGKKIGLAGFSMVYGVLDKDSLKEKIKELAKDTDLVIVNMHWGIEYAHKKNKVQEEYARLLIDNGADVVIGHHPHVVQGMEVYKGRPIFYSLGNFVFDQFTSSFPVDNRQSLGLGINYVDNELSFYLLPIELNNFQLELLAGEEKKDFFNNFIEWSVLEDDFIEGVKKGNFTMTGF